jgi:Concanavalin A-like lectin/glucanases superfamily
VNWTTAGDAVFNASSHSIDDIMLQPNNPNVLFVASNKGFYRSSDGGANFTRIIANQSSDAYFSEIEFKPNDANTMYVIQSGVADKYTEFYKSVDGGLTFTLGANWPVIATTSNKTYQYINRTATNNSHVSFTNDNLGTAANPNFTVEMRIRIPNAITDKAILSNKNWGSGANNGWTLAARYTGELMFNAGIGGTRLELLTGGIWDNAVHHVTVVWRNTGSKELYVDGVLKTSSTTNMTMPSNTGLPMILGKDGQLNYGAFDMDVDDIRIWNTALSAATVASNATTDIANTHPNYANLLHYYKCNSIAGNILTDEKATNNGTVVGTMSGLTTQVFSSTTNLANTDHQKRAEISVTAAKPNRVYALLSGAAYGGRGWCSGCYYYSWRYDSCHKSQYFRVSRKWKRGRRSILLRFGDGSRPCKWR